MTAARQMRQRPLALGRYRLVEPIAAGGMGTVHLALADERKDPVAVKLLHAHLASEERFIAMFFEEARLAATIFHRNVVEVFDVDRIDGEYLIAMRYVEGGALSRVISGLAARGGKKKMEGRVALRIVHDVLLGLHAAHEATNEAGEPLAIVHRDVSPQNVLVDFDGVAQLTDFGVARARGGLVTTNGDTIKGKLRYLAPEALERVTLDRRADVFSAGIILWELLRGEPLFAAESDAQVMRNVLDLPITPPGAPTLRLDEVCLKALERDPARRYGTAQEFARALETAARGKLATREEVAAVARDIFADEVSRLRTALALQRPPDSESIEHATILRHPGRARQETPGYGSRGSAEGGRDDDPTFDASRTNDDPPTLLNDDIEAALDHPTLEPGTSFSDLSVPTEPNEKRHRDEQVDRDDTTDNDNGYTSLSKLLDTTQQDGSVDTLLAPPSRGAITGPLSRPVPHAVPLPPISRHLPGPMSSVSTSIATVPPSRPTRGPLVGLAGLAAGAAAVALAFFVVPRLSPPTVPPAATAAPASAGVTTSSSTVAPATATAEPIEVATVDAGLPVAHSAPRPAGKRPPLRPHPAPPTAVSKPFIPKTP